MSTGDNHPFTKNWAQITSYDEAYEVFNSPDFAGGGMEVESLPFRDGTVRELDGELHHVRRRIQAALFGMGPLKFYERNVLDPALESMFRDLAQERDPDGVVRANLIIPACRILLQITAAFQGIDNVNTPERMALFHHYTDRLNAGVVVKWSLMDHAEIIREGLEAKRGFIQNFVAPSLARRRQLVSEFFAGQRQRSELPTDLITLTLVSHAAEEDEDLIVRECILYIAAGVYSTSRMLTYVIEEVEGWLVDHPEDRPLLTDSEFLNRATNETIRLHPPFPQQRRAVRDTVLKSGRKVRAGEFLALIGKEINRDFAVFGPDADRFSPYRSVPAGVALHGLGFGSGPKACPGRPLVTKVSGAPHANLDGLLVRMLKALYLHGVRIDRERPIIRPDTEGGGHLESFPVRFDNL